MTTIRLAAVAAALYLFASGTPTAAQRGGADHWIGTWATAPVARPQAPPGAGQGRGAAPLNFSNQTLRQVVHISMGGSRLQRAVLALQDLDIAFKSTPTDPRIRLEAFVLDFCKA